MSFILDRNNKDLQLQQNIETIIKRHDLKSKTKAVKLAVEHFANVEPQKGKELLRLKKELNALKSSYQKVVDILKEKQNLNKRINQLLKL